MNIRFMRKIDYYLGIPLCFAGTLLHKIQRLFVPRTTMIEQVDAIVFMKFLGIGTIVLSLPAIKKAQQLFPAAKLFYLTFKGNEQLKESVNILHNIEFVVIDTTQLMHFIMSFIRAIRYLRRQRITVCIDFEFFSRFSALTAFCIHSKYRIGFYNPYMEGLYRGDFLTHKVFYNHYHHTAHNLLNMIMIMKTDKAFPENKLLPTTFSSLSEEQIACTISYDETAHILAKFQIVSSQPMILLNPNCNENLIPLRKWPVEYFITVAQSLLASHPSLIIGIIGSKSEKSYVDGLLAQIKHPRVISFAGKTSLKELLVLLNHAVALITNDSGPAHLAALTKTYILTLFGPETPVLYAPLSKQTTNFYLSLKCSPCVTIYNGKRTVCDNNVCLKNIHPDHVIQMIEQEQLLP